MTTKDPRRQRDIAIHRLEARATCRGTGVQHDRTDLCGVANRGPFRTIFIGIAMIWYLITPPERPKIDRWWSKTDWVQGPGKSPKNLDDASVSLLPRGSAGWTNTTRILLQTCNTIVPFYRPGGVNRLVAFPNRQHRLNLIAAPQRYNGRVESLYPG